MIELTELGPKSWQYRTVEKRLCLAAAAATLLLMAGCSSTVSNDGSDTASPAAAAAEVVEPEQQTSSGGSEDSGETDQPDEPRGTDGFGARVIVADTGAEPRVVLQTADATSSTITVTATESDDTSVGDDQRRTDFAGDFDLHLSAAGGANGFTLTVDRTVRTLDAGGPQPVVEDIVGYTQSYDETGLSIFVVNPQEEAYRQLSGGLLSTPNLILAAPTDPVGVGAQWAIPLTQTGDLAAQVTVLAITDMTVEVDLSLERSSDAGTFSMTATGTYDRNSLFAHDVTTVSRISAESEASENGQLVPALSERESVRIYRAVSS